MSTPVLSKVGIIKVNSTAVGKATGFEYWENATPVKAHLLSGGNAEVLGVGDVDYGFKFDSLYVDDTYGTLLRAGTTFSVLLQPKGSTASLPEITLAGCVFTKRTVSHRPNAVVFENCEGVAKSETVGTISA